MSDQTPSEESDDTVEPLAAADDAFVAGLLADYGSDADTAAMPADVVARVDSAVLAEAQARATKAELAAGNVIPMQERRKAPGRAGKLLSVAAGFVVVALGVGVAVNAIDAKSNNDPTLTASGVPPVSTSGKTYDEPAFRASVTSLLSSPPTTTSPTTESTSVPTTDGATTSSPTASPNPSSGALSLPTTPVTPLAMNPDVQSFMADEEQQKRCLAVLTDGQDIRPLAVDVGYFKGKPAAVVVLPSTKADWIDVWIVGPDCDTGHDDVLYWGSLPNPRN